MTAMLDKTIGKFCHTTDDLLYNGTNGGECVGGENIALLADGTVATLTPPVGAIKALIILEPNAAADVTKVLARYRFCGGDPTPAEGFPMFQYAQFSVGNPLNLAKFKIRSIDGLAHTVRVLYSNNSGQIDSLGVIPITPAGGTETFKRITSSFLTHAQPVSGQISNNNLISKWTDIVGDAKTRIPFAACGNTGSVFGAKLILSNVAPSQTYKLYLFSMDAADSHNNGSIAPILFTTTGFIGVIEFSTLLSSATSETVYDGFLLNPLAFAATGGLLYAVLQNASGGIVTIPAVSKVTIDLSILSK